MNRVLALATNLFPIWVLLGGALALVKPAWLAWFSGEAIAWGFGGCDRCRCGSPAVEKKFVPICEIRGFISL